MTPPALTLVRDCNYTHTRNILHQKTQLQKIQIQKNFPLINAAYTAKTWAMHSSAMTCFKLYELSVGSICTWPLSEDNINIKQFLLLGIDYKRT